MKISDVNKTNDLCNNKNRCKLMLKDEQKLGYFYSKLKFTLLFVIHLNVFWFKWHLITKNEQKNIFFFIFLLCLFECFSYFFFAHT